MTYLPQYKVGSVLFRTLAELRHQLSIVQSKRAFNAPSPPSIQSLQQFLKNNPHSGHYTAWESASTLSLKEPNIILPSELSPFFPLTKIIEFPETFLFQQEEASVLGDGSCLLPDGSILSDTTVDFHRHLSHHHLLSKKIPRPESVKGTLAVIASPGSQNYFHWTLASLPRLLALKEAKIQPDFYYTDTQFPFHKQWLEHMGIPRIKIISATGETHLKPQELFIPSFTGTASLPSLKSIASIRDFIRSPTHNLPEKIFISRAKARRRKLVNESDLEFYLKKKGFVSIYPGELSLEQQMQQFSCARVVIASHGAELTNLIYCAPETKVIELFSPHYLNPCFRELAALCQLDYTAVIGRGKSHALKKGIDRHWVWSNMNINLGLLKEALA